VTGLVGRDFVADTGLNLLSRNLPEGSGSTYIDIAGYARFGEGREEPLTQKTIQFGDNITWITGPHTFKAGADVRHFNWTSPSVFTGADDFGVFRFRGSLTGGTHCSVCFRRPSQPSAPSRGERVCAQDLAGGGSRR